MPVVTPALLLALALPGPAPRDGRELIHFRADARGLSISGAEGREH